MGLGRVRPFPMRSVRLVLVACLLAFCGAAHSFIPPTINYVASGGSVTPGNLLGSPSWRAWGSLGGGSVSASDSFRAVIGQASADMQWRRSLTWGNVLRGSARAAMYAGPAALAVGVVATLWNAADCTVTTGGQISCDFGTSTVTVTCYKMALYGGAGPCHSSPLAAAQAYAAARVGTSCPAPGGYTCTITGATALSCGSSSCSIRDTQQSTFSGTTTPTNSYSFGAYGTSQGCANGSQPRADGKCSGAVYQPATEDQAVSQLQALGQAQQSNAPAIAAQAAEHVDLAPLAEPQSQPLTGPASVEGPTRTTTTTTNGQTSTRTEQTVYNMTYEGSTYSYNQQTETTNPDGSTETTTEEPEPVTCGLPGTPPCKIDETGTPNPTPADPQADVASATADVRARIANPSGFFPQLPAINWSFSLPSGCGAIALPGFDEYISAIDVCQFQSWFHDIMSIVWIGAGLFGAAGLFWRDQLAG